MPGVLPGERARVQVEHVGVHGRSFGRVLEIVEASPERVDPRCPHVGVCGGCDLLHASAGLQAEFKAQRVGHALGNLGDEVGVLGGLDLVREVPRTVPSPQPFGYRALAKLVVAADGTLGSYAPRSHRVVDMRGCLVHAPAIERIADRLRDALGPGHDLRYVLLRAALADERVIVTLVVRAAAARTPAALLPLLAAEPSVSRVIVHVNASEGDALLGAGPDTVLLERGAVTVERLGDVEQGLDSGAFAQINPAAAALLYARVRDGLAPRGRTILDLYSGSGGIALTLAAAGAAHVHGIERSADAVAAARASAARMGLADRVGFEAGPVEALLARAPRADAIVLNPPRKGATPAVLDGILGNLADEVGRDLAFPNLAYVSCEPTTLARDLAYLRARAALTILSVTPVDLFPQTRHVETLVLARLG